MKIVISRSPKLPPLGEEVNEWQLKALEKAPKTNGPMTVQSARCVCVCVCWSDVVVCTHTQTVVLVTSEALWPHFCAPHPSESEKKNLKFKFGFKFQPPTLKNKQKTENAVRTWPTESRTEQNFLQESFQQTQWTAAVLEENRCSSSLVGLHWCSYSPG